jgi:NAD(P)-dependent dehydrogenase (short-subunit alcohol dehydrogenase family)
MPSQEILPPVARVSTAIVFGVGARKGLGAALARRFAKAGLHVVLAARNAARLQLVADDIRESGGRADVVAADVTKHDEVIAALDFAAAKGPLELVIYNVGNNIARPLLELKPETFEALWRQNAYGGFLVGQESLRRLLPQGRGSILFTGATASLRARPPFTGFAAAKAALRAVAQGMAREFGPLGIHVAHVVIDGVIDGDYAAQNFPALVAAKGEEGLLNPDAVADVYWSLHQQPRSAWTHELDLRPAQENF